MTITSGSRPATGPDQLAANSWLMFMRFFLRFTEPGAVTIPATPNRDDDAAWGPERAHLLADTDPWGRPQLPGTSLAGALREMTRAAAGEAVADELFGRLLPQGTGGSEVDARASRIWVLGSRPAAVGGAERPAVQTQIRASTAVSRERAAAEVNTLRVDEVLPAGTRFEAFLRWDGAREADAERFAAWLADWRPLIGHGVSRGRGRCVVDEIRYGFLRLDEPDGLLRWLTTSGPELAREVASREPAVKVTADAGVAALARIGMKIAGPLRVGSGEPPVAAGDQGQQVTPMLRVAGRYVLPGTGLKGLLRSRAEYILRSIGAQPTPCLNQRCGSCWTCEVFGHAGGHDPSARTVGARAQVRVLDSVVADPGLVRRQHVAIDRFTGGAQDGLLYTVEALESGSFEIVVEQLAAGLAEDRVKAIRAVLRLVLEDLDDGIAGIGAAVARGYGSVRADLDSAVSRGDLPDGAAARAILRDLAGASSPTGSGA